MEEEYICNCCLVTEQEILDAVWDDNVTNHEELRAVTAATSGCGKCKIMCDHIINKALQSK